MQIGDQQRAMFGPIQRGIADYAKISTTKLQIMRQGSCCDWDCDSAFSGHDRRRGRIFLIKLCCGFIERAGIFGHKPARPSLFGGGAASGKQ